MPKDRFDEKIKELLKTAQEDYDTSTWDALSERLDQEGLQSSGETDFVPVVKGKLEKHRIPVPEEHWTSLKMDLDYIEERRERLYIIKALEAAIVLLLVYTYFNFQWHNEATPLDLTSIEEVYYSNPDPQLINYVLQADQKTALTSIIVSPTHKNTKQSSSLITTIAENSILEKQNSIEEGASTLPGSPKIIQDVSGDNLSAIEKLEINALSFAKANPSAPLLYVALDEYNDSPGDGWSIGIPVSYEANFINTDINLGYLSNQIESGLGGTSFGLSIAYRKGNYEIESGIRYSEKTFVPGLLTNYTKSGANSFLESQLDHMVIKQIQIPVLGKLYAAPYKKSTLYGVAGISLSTTVENEYAIRRTNQSKARLANAPTTDVVDLQNLPEGFFHGGSAKENIYITGVIGFGVQSYMTNGLSWYLQPQYQHSFKSNINVLVSQINTLSLEAGLKFSF